MPDVDERIAELEERAEIAEAEADALKGDVAMLKKLIGYDYLMGPQLSEADFRELLNPANELPNGDYVLGIAQKATNYIDRDQRTDITVLEAQTSGSVSVPPPEEEDDEIPDTLQELALALAPFFSDGVVNIGEVPGHGQGIIIQTPEGLTTVFYAADFDKAMLRIRTNLDPAVGPGDDFYSDKTLQRFGLDVERDGAVGLSVWKPFNSPAGPYDYEPHKVPMGRGKHLIIRPGGSNPDTGQVSPNVEMYSGLLKRNMVFGVSRTSPNVLDAVPLPGGGEVYGDLKIDGTNPTNPISITAEGQHQRVVVKVVNGERVFAPE